MPYVQGVREHCYDPCVKTIVLPMLHYKTACSSTTLVKMISAHYHVQRFAAPLVSDERQYGARVLHRGILSAWIPVNLTKISSMHDAFSKYSEYFLRGKCLNACMSAASIHDLSDSGLLHKKQESSMVLHPPCSRGSEGCSPDGSRLCAAPWPGSAAAAYSLMLHRPAAHQSAQNAQATYECAPCKT